MKRYALIGREVSTSLSPQTHEELFQEYNISAHYDLLSMEPDDALIFFQNMSEKGYVGFNITAPYKQTVISFLDECSNEAKKIGAVNTVKVEDGKCIGYNTDVDGFFHSLPESFREKEEPKVLLFGAGGAARAVLAALAREKRSQVFVVNRTRTFAEEMCRQFQNTNNKTLSIQVLSMDEDFAETDGFDLIVNATSAPFLLDGNENLVFFNKNMLKLLKRNGVLYDIKYGMETEKWKHALKDRGHFCLDGRTMLFYQALYAHVRWGNIPWGIDDSEILHTSERKQKSCFSTTKEEENRRWILND